jgi:hypothetical protein
MVDPNIRPWKKKDDEKVLVIPGSLLRRETYSA